jgi:serine/threonine protein kinase
MLNYDVCPNCFRPLGGDTVCGHCSFDIGAMKSPPGALPLFSALNNRYLLGRVLGKGGFGITYVAQDMGTGRICAIKEYIPSEYATRDDSASSVYPYPDQKARYVFEHGKEKFIEEAKTLLKLSSDPIVVDIWDYFAQNNTAYFAMEFLDGLDLRKMARSNGGTIDPELAKMVLVTVASSLMEIHRRNILHRDLSPENIIVTNGSRIKLIDFGAARNFVSNQNKGMSVLLKPGFAPPEQYSAKGVQGPWSDVYALCATFYNVVSGKALVDALFRYRGEAQPSLYSLGCAVTKRTSDVIEKGMALDHKLRYQDFRQLLDDIDINVTPQKKARSASPDVPSEQKPLTSQAGARETPVKSSSSQSPVSSRRTSADSNAALPAPYVQAFIEGRAPVKASIRENDILKIGRSRQNSNMVIDHDTNISRVHCYVRFDKARSMFYLSDVSANGTYLENGQRLLKNKEYALGPDTKFYLATKSNVLMMGLE